MSRIPAFLRLTVLLALFALPGCVAYPYGGGYGYGYGGPPVVVAPPVYVGGYWGGYGGHGRYR